MWVENTLSTCGLHNFVTEKSKFRKDVNELVFVLFLFLKWGITFKHICKADPMTGE